jgi:hypothetical protein
LICAADPNFEKNISVKTHVRNLTDFYMFLQDLNLANSWFRTRLELILNDRVEQILIVGVTDSIQIVDRQRGQLYENCHT